MTNESFHPIMMAESYWANSQFSIARHYGGIRLNGESYLICNKEGITIFELSDPASPYYVGDGVTKAIPPGEPADLVQYKWLPFYRAWGRNNFLRTIKMHTSFEQCVKWMQKRPYDRVRRRINQSVPKNYR